MLLKNMEMSNQMDAEMEEYFESIQRGVLEVWRAADAARKKGRDAVGGVEIPIARNMAERVEGLISVVAPQIKGCGMVARIEELEGEFGKLDWRVALRIAEEIAEQKFCAFKDKLEAMEVGIRVGIAYVTNGVVASPLEGFTHLKIKKRKDGGEYVALYFSGPIRSAGGTGASVSVIIGDYVRKRMGYQDYDISEEEVKRMVIELYDYHERITNLQYLPSEEEIAFMVRHLGVQIDGDASEKFDVSNYKDLPRIETNKIRNGICLVTGEGLCQKAAKLWKQLGKWGKEYGLEWGFLEEFLQLQKKIKAREQKKGESSEKIKPDYTFIKDIVAGRPVLTHPLRVGGFRLRYGRARNSGLSSMAIHPATMKVLDEYLAVGTQIKVERPSKGGVLSSCDSIDGPIVKLQDQSVVRLDTLEDAERYREQVEEILFLGDLLISYGDFFNRAHMLIPAGYCGEWWLEELKAGVLEKLGKVDAGEVAGLLKVEREFAGKLLQEFTCKISFELALRISREFGVPLHPRWTYHWKDISREQLLGLADWVLEGKRYDDRVVMLLQVEVEDALREHDGKRVLELLGVPHVVIAKEHVIIEEDDAAALLFQLEGLRREGEGDGLEILSKSCSVMLRDVSGTFIGARMGRPEKAKMRKLTGSPHTLFPVGSEGGKMRSFQACLDAGKITGDFPCYYCSECEREGIYPYCIQCGGKNEQKEYCPTCGKFSAGCGHAVVSYRHYALGIREYFEKAVHQLQLQEYPELIKGVRGTSNRDHTPENLVKGVLRACHGVYVNKDGTTRYDATEMAITAFTPREIGTSVEKLRLLGYTADIHGEELRDEEQLVELRCQDVILPAGLEGDEGSDIVLFRVSKFLDDLLSYYYGEQPFYGLRDKGDLVGHYILALAPHISAGTVCRIIGFSRTQGFYAHPMLHCAVRRDCFAHDTFIPLFDGRCWRNVKIGEFVEDLHPQDVVDAYGTRAKKVEDLWTLGYLDGKICQVKINEFTKHTPSPFLRIHLEDGRNIELTEEHKVCVFEGGRIVKKSAKLLAPRESLVVPGAFEFHAQNIEFIDLEEYFSERKELMVRGVASFVKNFINRIGGRDFVRKVLHLPRHTLSNFIFRDSFPLPLLLALLALSQYQKDKLPSSRTLAIKRDTVNIPFKIPLHDDVLNVIGLYVAEGFCRKKVAKKGLYQVSIACTEVEIQERIKRVMLYYFNLVPSEEHTDHLTFSSKILHELFTEILKAGYNAHTKRIPELILNLPREKLAAFLRGYFDGDGSVSRGELRVTCDSVSLGLLADLEFALRRFGIFTRKQSYHHRPGAPVRAFYVTKKREIPVFLCNKLLIPSDYCQIFYNEVGFSLKRKQDILKLNLEKIKPDGMKLKRFNDFVLPSIKSIEPLGERESYCLNVEGNIVLANGVMTGQCDGDEVGYMLLMDALLNFSRKYLPAHRGATQDAPLVLSSMIIPSEIDDMAFDVDIADHYPRELYEAALQYKMPWEVKIEQLKQRLGKPEQYRGWRHTHPVSDINHGVLRSAYKFIPSMQEKVLGQMKLAERIRAVDEMDVARLVIERHFIRDIRGNLRKFSTQEFRCVHCNEKFRRPPLLGVCRKCGGRIIFTIAEGSVTKYLEPSMSLARKFEIPAYLRQSLELTKMRIESVFGKESERQEGLGKWF